MAIQIGDVLGDYQVTGVLGRGGMGKVFRVRSLLTDREEAMKVLLPDFDENPDLEDRFLREIKTHARLQHPNIAGLRTALRLGDRLYMLMELVEGATLADKLREGPMSVFAAVECMNQVLSALAYAHAAGVIHRDIKPANILIANDGAVKLTDFGIARATDAARLTSTGQAVGTLAYMSPEQIRADATVDARSDLYSLGLVLYEMVTGFRAIQGDTAHSLMNAQLWAMPADPTAVNPSVPRWLSAAIMRALAKAPDARFQSAIAFRGALSEDESTRVVPLPNLPPLTPTQMAPTVLAPPGTPSPFTPPPMTPPPATPPPVSQAPVTPAPMTPPPSVITPTPTVTVAGAPNFGTPPPSVAFAPAALDRLVQALAPHIGPIAKVLVSRAAKRARTANELLEALAAEIPSEEDRRKFLGRARSIL
jgi:eukaryotic-like serine/threonine-protein kinase